MNDRFLLITFDSTHKAIRTEKMLKTIMTGELIPTPREISASCGLSFRFPEENLVTAFKALTENDGFLEGLALYLMEKFPDRKQVTKLDWENVR